MRASILAVPLTLFLATSALACGANPAAIGAIVDATRHEVKLDEATGEQVKALQAQIKQLVAAGKDAQARAAEEQAMNILGYKKVWLRCGPGTFAWMKIL